MEPITQRDIGSDLHDSKRIALKRPQVGWAGYAATSSGGHRSSHRCLQVQPKKIRCL